MKIRLTKLGWIFILLNIIGLILVGCSNDETDFKREPHNSVLEHQEYDLLQDKLPIANCRAFALFPKGNSVNTIDDEGVIVWECQVNGTKCLYIEPNGRLGASLSCIG